jgi:hypothetical protein
MLNLLPHLSFNPSATFQETLPAVGTYFHIKSSTFLLADAVMTPDGFSHHSLGKVED